MSVGAGKALRVGSEVNSPRLLPPHPTSHKEPASTYHDSVIFVGINFFPFLFLSTLFQLQVFPTPPSYHHPQVRNHCFPETRSITCTGDPKDLSKPQIRPLLFDVSHLPRLPRHVLPFVSCMTMELYFKKVISRLLVCTSASSESSTELITGIE